MEIVSNYLLSFILFSPVVAAIIVAILPRDQENLIRWTSFILSLIPLGLSIALWINFRPNEPGFPFQEQRIWYAPIHSSYHVGVDGISLTMVLLTTLLTPLALLASFTIKDRVKSYMALFFLLEFGMLGVFLTLDLLLFFVFWEFGLVPMYFLINQWGRPSEVYSNLRCPIQSQSNEAGFHEEVVIGAVSKERIDSPYYSLTN